MNRWFRPGRSPDRTRLGRLLRLALPLALALPLPTAASIERTLGGSDGQAGDPLDTNDCGGSDGDSHQSDPHLPAIGNYFWPRTSVGGRRILLIPVNEGGLLTFRLVIVDERPAPEPGDAR